MAGKGKGLKATRRIPRYSVILEEDPVLVRDQTNNAGGDEKLWEDFQNLSLTEEKVSDQQIQDILKLFDPEASKDDSSVSDKLMRIMGVNSMKLTNRMTNKTSQNLYLRISRINHSCRPNSCWKPDVHSNRCAVVSLATIEKNEEITVNYHFNLTDPRGQFCLSYQQRQLKMNSLYSFQCLCQLCQQVRIRAARLSDSLTLNIYFIFYRKGRMITCDQNIAKLINIWTRHFLLKRMLLDFCKKLRGKWSWEKFLTIKFFLEILWIV